MEIFGDLERLLSEVLYPYRVPLTAGAVLFALAIGIWMWRTGWIARLGGFIARRPMASVFVAFALLAMIVPLGNYLVAPLWTRSQVTETSPLDPSYREPQARASVDGPALSSPPQPAPFKSSVVSRGEWKGADEFHFARGRVLVVEVTPGRYVLRVEDFSVRNGPDLYVMLSPAAEGYRDGALELGRLRATDGSFNYEIPSGSDLTAFKSAVVWCKQFGVLFATAALTKA